MWVQCAVCKGLTMDISEEPWDYKFSLEEGHTATNKKFMPAVGDV